MEEGEVLKQLRKISGKLDKLKNLVFFLEKRITLVQDQIRIIGQTYIRGVSTYQDVCLSSGHWNRFGQMNLVSKPFILCLLVSHTTVIASRKLI